MKLTDKHNAEFLSIYERQYREGNKTALFHAIQHCGQEKIILPRWLTDEFSKSIDKWLSLDVKTLDEAFGIEWPKGKHFAAEQKKNDRRKIMFRVYACVESLREEGRAIDKSLFDEVGKKFNIGGTLADQYYYAVKKIAES